ncbi:DNA fragmentation factor subunit alpha isoform X1 [Lontra canadensis]|uniref:DNA fragmentation factor subunit alpha isoform X1 n=1 Tax=Lontra canadensis TaxID=76717 RepID=UPI0013F31221|nr:DNA fragmentation factor subunit alpha isoform X1 [Lontra canadensis]
MEVVGEAETETRALKPCLLRRNHSREQHGVAASCLEELRSKACDILAIDKSLAPVTLVLAEDGTIVDDDDYFLCLPSNTKFVALANNEKWVYSNSDGGTAWVSQESFDVDETDSGAGLKWKNVARQLKEDLSGIILLSEEDLQVLMDVPCSDLARELCQSCITVQGLQNALQQVLDQREEARQSKQLLELYLQALEKEGSILSKQQVGHQGRPQSACRCLELGRKEDGNSAAGLSPGAQPASPAGAEPAFSPEHVLEEELATWRTEGAQASQTRACVAAAGEPVTLFLFTRNTFNLIPRAAALLLAAPPFHPHLTGCSPGTGRRTGLLPFQKSPSTCSNDEAVSTEPRLF